MTHGPQGVTYPQKDILTTSPSPQNINVAVLGTWNQKMNSPAGRSVAPSGDEITSFQQRYAVQKTVGSGSFTSAGVRADPLVDSDDNVYVKTLDDVIFSVAPDGTRRWQTDLEPTKNSVWGSPTPILRENESRLLVTTSNGRAFEVATDDGSSTQLADHSSEADDVVLIGPRFNNGVLFYIVQDVGSGRSFVAYGEAIDAADGSVQWTYEFGPNNDNAFQRWIHPASDGDTLYIGNSDDNAGEDGHVFAVNWSDGSEKWDIDTADAGWPTNSGRREYLGSPTYLSEHDIVVFPSDNWYIFGVDPADGSRVWSTEQDPSNSEVDAMDAGGAYHAASDTYIGNGTSSGYHYGITAEDGTRQWRIQLDEAFGSGQSELVVQDDTYYVSTITWLTARDPADGSLVNRTQVSSITNPDHDLDSAPVTSGEGFWVNGADEDGYVYGFEESI